MTVGKSLVEDMTRLRPCPFCGIEMSLSPNGRTTFHQLTGSDCTLSGWHFSAEAWNARSETAALSVLKDRLPADDRELVERLRLRDARWQGDCDQWVAAAREQGVLSDEAEATMRQTIYAEAADRITALSASRGEK